MVLDAVACSSHSAVALEAPAKAQLPSTIALLDTTCMLQIGQDISGQQERLQGLRPTLGPPAVPAFVLPCIDLPKGDNMSDASVVSAWWHNWH